MTERELVVALLDALDGAMDQSVCYLAMLAEYEHDRRFDWDREAPEGGQRLLATQRNLAATIRELLRVNGAESE